MTETDAPKKRRLNPFAFPSETNVHFTLLVVAAMMLAFNLGLIMGWGTGLVKYQDAPALDVNVSDPVSVEQGLTQAVSSVALPGALMLSVLILATVIYRGHPSRIRRNKNLRLMTRSDDAQFVDAVQNLVKLSGISPAPSIEVAAGSRSVDGQAFGLHKHYALRLGGRLRLLLRQSPNSFRAIVLHELAHIANADVARTYFAQAIWIATVILIIIPAIVFIAFKFTQGLTEKLTGGLTSDEWIRLFTLNLPTVLVQLFQFGGTLAIVVAIRGSLLRIREVYADWRAALWGAETPLADILRRNASADKTARWARLWRLHPTSQERLAALQNPDRLFHVTTELPFFVGVLLAYVLSGAVALVAGLVLILQAGSVIAILQLSKGLDNPLIFPIPSFTIDLIFFATWAAFLATALAVGLGAVYLVAGALGLAVQRETVADMITGRQGWATYLSLWKPAALVTIGFQMGILLIPFGILGLLPELASNSRGLISFLMVLLLTATIGCLTWLWLVYIRFFAWRTLGSHVSQSSPQSARRLLTLASSGLLLVLYLPAVIGQFVIIAVATDNMTILTQMLTPLFVTVVISLFLYIAIFGATWLLAQAHRLVWRPHCPTCKQVTRQRYAVGQLCEHCGQSLAPWLFAN
jgi:Zn-dependent protease with chaperone function